MASQDEVTKPKRLKFSRLCLSQNRNPVASAPATTALVRSSTQVSSSQISRFFTHSDTKGNDETHRKQENANAQNQNQNSNDESGDCLKSVTESIFMQDTTTKSNGSDDNQPLSGAVDKPDENKTHRNKRKHGSKSDKKTDSKSTIKSFFSNELNDSLADFETPSKIAKKIPKVLPSKVVKKSRSHRKQQPDIRKALNKEDAARDDYSHLPEDAQLELALAISKAESVNGIVGIADGGASSSSKTPVDLNAFAFKPANSKSNDNIDVLNFFNMNRKTKTRFKWNTKCTQLTLRNDDTQKSKVQEKIDEILLNNIIVESSQADRLKSCEQIDTIDYSPHFIHSRRLQRICISERILYELNNCDKNTKSNIRSYYTNNLVDVCETGAETLLKDWSKIPGRDKIYDGLENTASKTTETDTMTVISSSPEYDTQTEASSSDVDTDKRDDQMENTLIVNDDQQMDTAGCSNVNQSSPAMNIASDNAVQDMDDNDRTIVMNLVDIESKINEINSNNRLSQQFGENFDPSDFTCQADTVIRAPSPDLFDDDDDDVVEYCADNDLVVSDENQETSDRGSPVITTIDDDDETCCGPVEVASEDVITISSSEGNTKECYTEPVLVSSEDFQSKTQHSNTHDNVEIAEKTENSENTVIETIELLDSDSEGMLKERIVSPKVHLSQAAGKSESSEYALPNMTQLDEEYRNLMQSLGCVTHEQPTHSAAKSNETPPECKKLSFTERLELFEKDMLNGFTADLPDDILNQSQQQQQQLSQDSIDLSDDEINYSMRLGSMPKSASDNDDHDDFDMNHLTGECDIEVRSPIEFDSNSNSNLNHSDTEQNLVNQSVCNIFEKTFEKCVSPITVNKNLRGAKTLKKFQSETVLSTHYGHAVPSTSTASISRIQTIPTKNKFQFESPQKTKKYSPISQPPVETRMDLSNDEYYIRIGSSSPKPNYEKMDAFALEKELRKYGLKPSLSRRQAIICLEYIYNRTHPFMESGTDLSSPLNGNKFSSNSNNHLNVIDEAICTNRNGIDADPKDPQINFNVGFAAHNLVDEKFKCRDVDKVFLPSVPRAKKPWCLEPLHIAWHNLIKANPDLRKAVLLYEPINLIELKKFFKTIDMTFDNRDLIAFLDLHCITFRMIKASKE